MEEEKLDETPKTAGEQPITPNIGQVSNESEIVLSNAPDEANAPGPLLTKAPYSKGLIIALIIGFILLIILVTVSLVLNIPDLFNDTTTSITT